MRRSHLAYLAWFAGTGAGARRANQPGFQWPLVNFRDAMEQCVSSGVIVDSPRAELTRRLFACYVLRWPWGQGSEFTAQEEEAAVEEWVRGELENRPGPLFRTDPRFIRGEFRFGVSFDEEILEDYEDIKLECVAEEANAYMFGHVEGESGTSEPLLGGIISFPLQGYTGNLKYLFKDVNVTFDRDLYWRFSDSTPTFSHCVVTGVKQRSLFSYLFSGYDDGRKRRRVPLCASGLNRHCNFIIGIMRDDPLVPKM